MKNNHPEIKFRKANRWIIAGLGALLYWLIKEALFAFAIAYYGESVADENLNTALNVLFVALWAIGWKGNYVDQGFEGVIKFFGKAMLTATLDNGSNWLPLFFSTHPLPTKRLTLNIPATAGEKGFEVTSVDGVSMLTRIGVPYWYDNIVQAILHFDPEGDIDMIRDTAIEVMRTKAGLHPSLVLQRHQVPDEFRTELSSRLELLVKKYPFRIDIPLITIAKFSPSDAVKKSQESKVDEEGQREGQIVEADHIEARTEKRRLYYAGQTGVTPEEAIRWAREDVQQQLKQLTREVVEVRGDGSNLQKAATLATRKQQPPT